MGQIRIVDEYRPGLRDFLLSNVGLSRIPDRGTSRDDNNNFFSEDFKNGLLKDYDGTYVAYHKGTLIGQYTHRNPLIEKVREVHDTSSLTVYIVTTRDLEFSVNSARTN